MYFSHIQSQTSLNIDLFIGNQHGGVAFRKFINMAVVR